MPIFQFRLISIIMISLFLMPIDLKAEDSLTSGSLSQEDRYASFYKRAQNTLVKGDYEAADFWIARYLSEMAQDPRREKNVSDLYPLFKQHSASRAAFTMPGQYHPDFLRWFIFSSYAQWGVPDPMIDESTFKFELDHIKEGNFTASIFAFPHLEGWLMLEKKQISTSIVVVGDPKKTPYIEVHKINENGLIQTLPSIKLDIEGHSLHHVWPLEFFDLDKDGSPELWVRYIYNSLTGFNQELAIYKIEEDQLSLFKKFTGEREGVARHLDGNAIEVANGFSKHEFKTPGDVNHLHFETWGFYDGIFNKVTEWNVPHVLTTELWQKYYMDE